MSKQPVFPQPSPSASQWVAEQLRNETIGGLLLAGSALIALVWANSPAGNGYRDFMATVVGPASWHLDLTLAAWASDGLLTVFFLVVGLELKHELVSGSLARPSHAVVPIAAALGGMVVPALFYLLPNLLMRGGQPAGWGVPMATDIAFALAILALAGPRLPFALRAFLLTSAIVDDIGAIIVIALFYSGGLSVLPLLCAALALGLYALAQRRGMTNWLALPLGIVAWSTLHASGVHATIAGVLLGLLTRAHVRRGEARSPADRMQHGLHPLSAGVAVPLFALTAAGVQLEGLGAQPGDPVVLGIGLGLMVGKPVGVFGTAWLVARFTRAELSAGITWRDVAAVAMLSGIGFTVALLISGLAFADAQSRDSAKLMILLATIVMGVASTLSLRLRSRQA